MYLQHVNVEHNIHDETLDSIADIVQDSEPAIRGTPRTGEDQTGAMDLEGRRDMPAESERALATVNGDSANVGAVTRTLLPGDFISIEMNDGPPDVIDESTPSGGTDPGTYKLVHYKAPEPHTKRKRLKIDPNKAQRLGPSEYVSLDTKTLGQAMKELSHESQQGVVELTNGDVRPAEVNVTVVAESGTMPVSAQKSRQPISPSGDDSLVNGSAIDQDDHVDSSATQPPADYNSQFNSINGSPEPIVTRTEPNSVHRIVDQSEIPSDITSDSVSADPSNLHRLKLVDGAREHKDKVKARSASKRTQDQRAEQMGDTDIVSITVPPGNPAQDLSSTDSTKDDPRQQILLMSTSTVRHPSNAASKDGAKTIRSEESGTVTESDMQVVGIQPLIKDAEPVQKCK